jgi:hypothetical protein
MARVLARGTTFIPRGAPDAASYISRSISSSPYKHIVTVCYAASKEDLAQRFSSSPATIEADGPDSCVVTAGADNPETLALYLAMVGCDFEIQGPPEVIAGARSIG